MMMWSEQRAHAQPLIIVLAACSQHPSAMVRGPGAHLRLIKQLLCLRQVNNGVQRSTALVSALCVHVHMPANDSSRDPHLANLPHKSEHTRNAKDVLMPQCNNHNR
jgi:hypothetical protein